MAIINLNSNIIKLIKECAIKKNIGIAEMAHRWLIIGISVENGLLEKMSIDQLINNCTKKAKTFKTTS